MSQGNNYQYSSNATYEAAYTTPIYAANPPESTRPTAANNAGWPNYSTNYGYAHSTKVYGSPKGNFSDQPKQPEPVNITPQVKYQTASAAEFATSSGYASKPQNVQAISVIGQPSYSVKSVLKEIPMEPTTKPVTDVKPISDESVSKAVPPMNKSEHVSVSQQPQEISKQTVTININQPKPVSTKNPEYYCELCKVKCNGQVPFQNHMNSRNHKKRETNSIGKAESVSFYCEKCNVKCSCTVTYEAHLQGAKHKHYVNLQTCVGNPVPPEIGVAASEETPKTLEHDLPKTDEKIEVAESPRSDLVGQECIEKRLVGKVLTIFCKLCDCSFTDPSAIDMHLKGRKHRLIYKNKVERLAPSVRENFKFPFPDEEDFQEMRAGFPPPPFVNPFYGVMDSTLLQDDKYVTTKHSSIYPPVADIKAIQNIVEDTERALKLVSVELTEARKIAKVVETTAEESESQKKQTPGKDLRVLKGVMKVGDFAKGLLLKGDFKADLVVLCAEIPTFSILEAIANKLPKHLEPSKRKYEVVKNIKNEVIIVSSTEEPKVEVTIALTSPMINSEVEAGFINPPDMLDITKCLESLRSVRHTRWFHECAANLGPCPMTIRILRDFCQRVPVWRPLDSWLIELLVQKTINSLGKPVSPGESLRYIFEAISSGILLPTGPGIQDPCEKEGLDLTEKLTDQQREEITASAQHGLRLISFSQIHIVLGMDELPPPSTATKRPHDDSTTDSTDNKKEKKEDISTVM